MARFHAHKEMNIIRNLLSALIKAPLDLLKFNQYLVSLITAIIVGGLLTACGGGAGSSGGSGNTGGTNTTPTDVLKSIQITPSNVVLTKDTTVSFVAIGTYENSTTKALTDKDISDQVKWKSNQSLIASISASGLSGGIATGVNAGAATINASFGTGNNVINSINSASILVTNANLDSISVIPGTSKISVGSSSTYKAIGNYSDGQQIDISKQVLWEIQNNYLFYSPAQMPASLIATIDPDTHIVTGQLSGSSIVTASWSAVTSGSSAIVTVTDASLSAINIASSSTSLPKGDSVQFTATGVFSDGNADVSGTVIWKSSNNSIATIDETGSIKALAIGSTVINASITDPISGNIIVSNDVNFQVTPPVLISIATSNKEKSIAPSGTYQFSVTGYLSDGSEATINNINPVWSSNNNAIVSVSPTGLATAVAIGQSYLTVTSNNGLLSKNIYINVSPIKTPLNLTGLVSEFWQTELDAISLVNAKGLVVNNGNLYIADTFNNRIVKTEISTGISTTFAGPELSVFGEPGLPGSQDGIGTIATFNQPHGITTDGDNLYIADTNNKVIRKIVIATTEVSTIAGTGQDGVSDGNAAIATFSQPFDLTVNNNVLYISDVGNNNIRKIDLSTNDVYTLAGSKAGNNIASEGSINGIGTNALFVSPGGLVVNDFDLYVADTGNNVIRRIFIPTGEVTTFSGTVGSDGYVNGTSNQTKFSSPFFIATDGENLFVTDASNNTVRKILISDGSSSALAGNQNSIGGNSVGSGASANFNFPAGIAIDGTSIYVNDSMNSQIRQIK
jgi:sugar lactone lactonase YvrE